MTLFSRADNSTLSQWWWTVDKWALGYLLAIVIIGVILNLAASPAVAERLHLPTFYFVERHLVILPVALTTLIGLSMMPIKRIKQFSLLLFLVCLVLLLLTLWFGIEIKGATRWLSLGGFSLQPSEIIKPVFAVVTAWLFTLRHQQDHFPGYSLSLMLYGLVVTLIMMQPDLGMTFVITAVYGAQFFLAGLSYALVIALFLLGICGLIGAYFIFPHVQKRVDLFLYPQGGDTYQIEHSLNAFRHGGLFGTGPGEGTVKQVIPDVHADFVFAVAGEEFGFFMCMVILLLFAMVVLSGYLRLMKDKDLFVVLAAGGILTQFGLQALINIGSTLNLIPTKGMTLPFISYGGSSLLALGIGMGIVLSLTRNRAGAS